MKKSKTKKSEKKLRLLPDTKYDPKDGRDFDFTLKVWYDGDGDQEWIVEVLGSDGSRPFAQMVSSSVLEVAFDEVSTRIEEHIRTGKAMLS